MLFCLDLRLVSAAHIQLVFSATLHTVVSSATEFFDYISTSVKH